MLHLITFFHHLYSLQQFPEPKCGRQTLNYSFLRQPSMNCVDKLGQTQSTASHSEVSFHKTRARRNVRQLQRIKKASKNAVCTLHSKIINFDQSVYTFKYELQYLHLQCWQQCVMKETGVVI